MTTATQRRGSHKPLLAFRLVSCFGIVLSRANCPARPCPLIQQQARCVSVVGTGSDLHIDSFEREKEFAARQQLSMSMFPMLSTGLPANQRSHWMKFSGVRFWMRISELKLEYGLLNIMWVNIRSERLDKAAQSEKMKGGDGELNYEETSEIEGAQTRTTKHNLIMQ